MKNILSIVIPTFNRSIKLEKQLKNLIKQISQKQELAISVEIVVNDNCSDDSTGMIVDDIIKLNKHINLKYYKNESNLGFDRNVDIAIKNAHGKYVWILSDDDDISSCAVKRVVFEIIESQNLFNFMFINYNIVQGDNLYKSNLKLGSQKVSIGRNSFSILRFANSFISSCIFEKKSWLSIETEKYFDTLWIHLFVMRDVLIKGNLLICEKELITMQQPSLLESRKEKSDYVSDEYGVDFYTSAHIRLSYFCKELVEYGYPVSESNKAEGFCRKGDIGHIINYKLSTKFNLSMDVKVMLQYYRLNYNKLRFITILLPLLAVPSPVFKQFKQLKQLKQFNKLFKRN
jgi:glycosyltransferase involved in cell wall biosynthesis